MATSNWLNTAVAGLYYVIEITENGTNSASNLSPVTVKVNFFTTNASSYAVDGTVHCNIDGVHYMSSVTKAQSINATVITLFEKTLNIFHDDDGYKELTVSAWITSSTAVKSEEQSFSVDLTPIHRISQPSCITHPDTTQNVGDFGDTITIYTNRKRTEYFHEVSYHFGEKHGTIASNVTDSVQWKIPLELMEEIPYNTSGVGTIDVYTIANVNGVMQPIGNRTVSFTATVPLSMKPTIDSVTLTDQTGLFDTFGKYVQGWSDLDIDIVASGVYGSNIDKYNTTIDGKSYTNDSFSIKNIAFSGNKDITINVIDTRGRFATDFKTISVYPYFVPKITALKVSRCDKDGTANSKGLYLKVVFSASVTSLDNKNDVLYSIEYKKSTETRYTTEDLTIDAKTYICTDETFIFEADTSASYNVILTIEDGVTSVSKGAVGPSIKVLWSRLAKGLGFAFGKVAEFVGVLDIAFKTRFTGGIDQIVLAEGTDFDTLLTPNIYSGLDASKGNYLNCPIDDGTFTLEVIGAGDEGQVIHRVTSCVSGVPVVITRHYDSATWGAWVPIVDFVIEQGTTDEFTFEKRHSGKVELWGYKTYSITFEQSMQGGTHWKCDNIRLAFPKDSNGNNLFTSYKFVDIKPMWYSSGEVKTAQVLGVSVSEQYVDYFIEHKATAAETSPTAVTVYFHIIGTWK